MRKEDICFMSANELAEKLKSQELTSEEITEIMIERIEKINPSINAFCTFTFELARESAKKADKRIKRKEEIGLLDGIPISIKDETDTKGIRTTYGCKIFEDNIPHNDEAVVRRVRDAGAVILGKTNTPAFGYKGETDNLIFGTTKNPWNLKKTTGGSSGGAAAAVISGLGPIGIGSDGGGSIRIPSSFCGLFGIKPTYGRVPHNIMQLMGNIGTLVQKGPLVRYVEDAALVLDIIAGLDDSDRYSVPKPGYSYLEKLNDTPKSLNIGYSLDIGTSGALDPEVEDCVINAIQKFEEFGWFSSKSKLKLSNAEPLFLTFWSSGFAHTLGPYLAEWQDRMEPDLVNILNYGLSISAKDLKIAEVQRERIYSTICRALKKLDVLITPTLACPAFEIGKSLITNEETGETDIIINGKKVNSTGWLYTYPFNLSGHPAVSVPCGFSKDGLPIGMQIVGKRYDELTLLQVSKKFEEIVPWQGRRPKFE